MHHSSWLSFSEKKNFLCGGFVCIFKYRRDNGLSEEQIFQNPVILVQHPADLVWLSFSMLYAVISLHNASIGVSFCVETASDIGECIVL